MDRQTDGQMGEWMDGQGGGWVDRRMNELIDGQPYFGLRPMP